MPYILVLLNNNIMFDRMYYNNKIYSTFEDR